jgi:hypothetical protein
VVRCLRQRLSKCPWAVIPRAQNICLYPWPGSSRRLTTDLHWNKLQKREESIAMYGSYVAMAIAGHGGRSRSQSYFTTDFQLVCLGIEHPCGTYNQILLHVRMLQSEICGFVSMGRPLWREDGSAICSKWKLLYDLQSVYLGIEHPCGTCDQILLPVGMLQSEICGFVSMGRPLWREDGSAICSEVEITLRLMIGQYVLFLRPDITSCWDVAVWNLRSCIYWTPYLTRGRVCNLQCNHSMVRVAQNPRPYFTVSSETPPTWRARFPYFYPPWTGWPSYTPGNLVPFTSPLTFRRDYGGSILPSLTRWRACNL